MISSFIFLDLLIRPFLHCLHTCFVSILLSYFIQSRGFLYMAYLTVANLARLGISVHC